MNWNELIIAEFRANAGQVDWSSDADLAAGRPVPPRLPAFAGHASVPIILLHHTGARTGHVHVTPLVHQPIGDGFAVFGTYGGSPRDPLWTRNLLANPSAVAELGTGTVPVTARLAEGAERERVWAAQVAAMPAFADFERRAGRPVPVFLLDRESASSPGRPG